MARILHQLRRNLFALDVLLVGFLLLAILLSITGALQGGRFTVPLLAWFVPATVGYLLYQRLAIRFERWQPPSDTPDAQPPKWLTIATLLFFISSFPIIVVSFLNVGYLMLDNNLIPPLESHADFDPSISYDPDHASRLGPDGKPLFQPYEVDPERPGSLNLGPHGGSTAWDLRLKNADIAVFGVYPPVWIRQFHTPALSGLLMLGYVFYYFAPLLAGVPLFFRRRRRSNSSGEHEPADEAHKPKGGIHLSEFRVGATVIGGCILLTYVLYLFFPSTGPRFEGGGLAWLPEEPGWFGAEWLYILIDKAETFRWCAFPSGHVAVSLSCLFVALKFRPKIGLAMLVPVLLLCICTVYNGYHYAVDVLGGLACAGLSIWLLPKFADWWEAPHREPAEPPTS